MCVAVSVILPGFTSLEDSVVFSTSGLPSAFPEIRSARSVFCFFKCRRTPSLRLEGHGGHRFLPVLPPTVLPRHIHVIIFRTPSPRLEGCGGGQLPPVPPLTALRLLLRLPSPRLEDHFMV